jgi:hypothetical protein
MEDSQIDSKHVNLILGVVSSFGKPMRGLMPQRFTDSIKKELWQEVEVSGDFEVSDAAPFGTLFIYFSSIVLCPELTPTPIPAEKSMAK